MKPPAASDHADIGRPSFISPGLGVPAFNLDDSCRRCQHEVSRLHCLLSRMYRFCPICTEMPCSLPATDRRRATARTSEVVIAKCSSTGNKKEARALDFDGNKRGLMQERDPYQQKTDVTQTGVTAEGRDKLVQNHELVPAPIRNPLDQKRGLKPNRDIASHCEGLETKLEEPRASVAPFCSQLMIEPSTRTPKDKHFGSACTNGIQHERRRGQAVGKTEENRMLGMSSRALRQREKRRRQRAEKAARKALSKRITILGKEGHWRDAIAEADAARADGLEPDVFVYGSCIGATAHCGEWREALRLVCRMRAEGIQPNTAVYNAAIHACDRAGEWRFALRLLGGMRGCQDVFSAWLDQSEGGDQSLLEATVVVTEKGNDRKHVTEDGFGEISRRDGRNQTDILLPEPNIRTFNSVMSACSKAGEWQLALDVMQAARERELVPTRVTYNTAVSACARAGEAETALLLLREMPKVFLNPDAFSFNSAIAACAKRGFWRRALSLVGEMKSSVGASPDKYTFASTITACARARQWSIALRLLDLMHLEGVEPGRVVLNAAISACGGSGQWERALELLREMTEKAKGDKKRGEPSSWPDSVSFNSAMKACSNAGEWRRALMLLDEMESNENPEERRYGKNGHNWRPPLPDEVSYSTAIAACSRVGESQEALGLLDRMRKRGLPPTPTTFTAAMTACRRGGRPGNVATFVARMRAYGVEPDAICYGEALWCCAEASLCELASELVAEIERRGLPMNLNARWSMSIACATVPPRNELVN